MGWAERTIRVRQLAKALTEAVREAEKDREHRGKSAFLPEYCDKIVEIAQELERWNQEGD